jgi:hypothetical protein
MKKEIGVMTETGEVQQVLESRVDPGGPMVEAGVFDKAGDRGGRNPSKMKEPVVRPAMDMTGDGDKEAAETGKKPLSEEEVAAIDRAASIFFDFGMTNEEKTMLTKFKMPGDEEGEEVTMVEAVRSMGDGFRLMGLDQRWDAKFIRGFKQMDEILAAYPESSDSGKELRGILFGGKKDEQDEKTRELYEGIKGMVEGAKAGEKIDFEEVMSFFPDELKPTFQSWMDLIDETNQPIRGGRNNNVMTGVPAPINLRGIVGLPVAAPIGAAGGVAGGGHIVPAPPFGRNGEPPGPDGHGDQTDEAIRRLNIDDLYRVGIAAGIVFLVLALLQGLYAKAIEGLAERQRARASTL